MFKEEELLPELKACFGVHLHVKEPREQRRQEELA